MSNPVDLTRRADGGATASCCDSHDDWPTLTEHLIVAFPDAGLEEIVRAVAEAKTSTDGMELPDPEALRTGEVLARLRLQERASVAGALAPQPRGSRAR